MPARTFDIDDLTLGDLAEATRIAVKAAASDILRLSARYKREGAARHESPLRAAYGYLTDALRSLDHGVEQGGRDLAANLEATLALPRTDGPPNAESPGKGGPANVDQSRRNHPGLIQEQEAPEGPIPPSLL